MKQFSISILLLCFCVLCYGQGSVESVLREIEKNSPVLKAAAAETEPERLSGKAETAHPFRPPSVDSEGWQKCRQRPETRRSASRPLQQPIRESFSERGERPCRDEGQKPTRSQPDEAERGSQFNGG